MVRVNVMLVFKINPILTFDSGSYIKYVKDKKVLSLKAMTIHTPSLHTINGTQYDMEVVLYHKLGGNMEPRW